MSHISHGHRVSCFLSTICLFRSAGTIVITLIARKNRALSCRIRLTSRRSDRMRAFNMLQMVISGRLCGFNCIIVRMAIDTLLLQTRDHVCRTWDVTRLRYFHGHVAQKSDGQDRL